MGNEGKIVTIDIDTGEFEVDENVVPATNRFDRREVPHNRRSPLSPIIELRAIAPTLTQELTLPLFPANDRPISPDNKKRSPPPFKMRFPIPDSRFPNSLFPIPYPITPILLKRMR